MKQNTSKTSQADLLAGVLDSSLDGIYAFQSERDETGQIVDFIFVVVNRAAETLVGRTAKALLGKRMLEVLPGNKTDGLFDAYINVVESREPFVTEHYYEHDGLANWFSISATPYGDGFTVSFADITAQMHSKERLRLANERLEFALQASSTGLWDWHVETGQTYFSDTWYTMLGYEPGELPMTLQSWMHITEPGDLENAKNAIQDYFNNETERYACEMRVKNKAGNWQWILDVGEAVQRDDQGKVTRMVGLHVDIDEQKRNQFELTQALDQAEQANHAKSAFVANMSHEIRTPMNAILGYADLLLDGGQTDADKRNHAQTIRRNGKHLMNILNDILDLSKIEAGKLITEHVSFDPNELIEDVIGLLSTKADRQGISLRFEEIGDLPRYIKSDPTRIRQVLLNLIGNAIKFTEQGEVRLAASIEPSSDQGEGRSLLTCKIHDTGIGISPEQQAQLFDPFSQADESTTRKFGGTGLGLSISKNLCTMLGGHIACESALGQGSTFIATFAVEQVQPDKTKAIAKSEATINTDEIAGKRVLIVEDGPDNQRLFNHYVTKAGAIVELAENGAVGKDAALAAWQSGQPFDVMLMDMQMPVLDGYEATTQLRDAGYIHPIIALTAHASASDREKCLQAGCTDYLSKPVDRHKLLQVVAQYVSTQQPFGQWYGTPKKSPIAAAPNPSPRATH